MILFFLFSFPPAKMHLIHKYSSFSSVENYIQGQKNLKLNVLHKYGAPVGF